MEIDEDTLKMQITPKIPNKSTKRRVARSGVLFGDSKFRCQDCESIFNSKQALWYHTKSKHEGVKYACNQCDYEATQQWHLTTHIQSLHEGVKYTCNVCDQQFTQKSHLKTHRKRKH